MHSLIRVTRRDEKGWDFICLRGTHWIWWFYSSFYSHPLTQSIEQISSSNSSHQNKSIQNFFPLHSKLHFSSGNQIDSKDKYFKRDSFSSTFFSSPFLSFFSSLSLSKRLTKLHILSSLLFPFSPFLFPLYNFKFFSL